jgi:hypothetical protein
MSLLAGAMKKVSVLRLTGCFSMTRSKVSLTNEFRMAMALVGTSIGCLQCLLGGLLRLKGD